MSLRSGNSTNRARKNEWTALSWRGLSVHSRQNGNPAQKNTSLEEEKKMATSHPLPLPGRNRRTTIGG